MSAVDRSHGGAAVSHGFVDVYPSRAGTTRSVCIYVCHGMREAMAHLTPAEARDIAQRLQDVAADVAFADVEAVQP